MTDRVSLRAGIPPFYVMDVWLAAAERQRSHGDLVNLSAGQPSVRAPEPVRAAAAAAVHSNQLGYSVSLGTPELRAAIAADYRRQHGLDVEPDAVVITTGLGRLPADLPGLLRRRRPGGPGQPRLSVLPKHLVGLGM